MKKFDIHAWFGHWPWWDLYQKTPEELIAQMDRHGIARAACMSLRGVVEWRGGSEETLAVCRRFADRLLPVVTVAPCHGGGGEAFEKLIDLGAIGVRLYPFQHNYKLQLDFVDEICAVAARRHVFVCIPIRIMSSWRFPTLEVFALDPIIERHPQTTFLMSGINYVAEFAALVRMMRKYPNVVYEHSCLQGYKALAALVGYVSAERVLFGTGALLHNPACNVAKLESAELTDEQRQAVALQNAHRLLGLSG